MSKRRQYWLLKSEPSVYSIERLEREGVTAWEGVRNYQARNFLRAMAVGDEALFYHSNAEPPGVVGVARVVREAYPDHHAHDRRSKYYDPKSSEEAPRWSMVDLAFVEAFQAPVTLAELKADPKLGGMEVTRKGSRLSVQQVEKAHFEHVLRLGRAKGGDSGKVLPHRRAAR